jgi:hypothetical protein
VAQPDQLKPSIVFQRFVKIQHEVAWNSEDLSNAFVPELAEQKGV